MKFTTIATFAACLFAGVQAGGPGGAPVPVSGKNVGTCTCPGGATANARRDLDTRSTGELTIVEVVDAIHKNQKLPPSVEAALDSSPVAQQYNIPKNRSPVNPAYAHLNTDMALKALHSGNIPHEVQQAVESTWPKKGAAKNGPTVRYGATGGHGNGDKTGTMGRLGGMPIQMPPIPSKRGVEFQV